MTPLRQILLVDDHALFRSGLELILRSHFPDVSIRQNASIEAALDESVSEPCDIPPDVILLDIALGGMTGVQGLDLVRARWPGAAVIMVSAQDDAHSVEDLLAAGADGFVSKAEPPQNIVRMIGNLAPRLGQGDTGAQKPKAFTVRQREILSLVRAGDSNKTIARKLVLSEFTVRGHVQAILKALGVSTRTAAAFEAQKRGWDP